MTDFFIFKAIPMNLTDSHLLRQHAYINGQWVSADNGATFTVTNPADDTPITEIARVGAAETRRAIEAANDALPAWRDKTAKARATILRRWFTLMQEHKEDLARLLSWEQGKPLTESRGEIDYGTSFIEWFAEEGKRVYGDVIPNDKPDRRLVVIKQPIGVVAAITPWNFPIAMITRKAGPALAAGCTMVLKPASETPLSALALAELAERAGVPAGVFSVVTGRAGEIGSELTHHESIRKLSFTGSTEIGRQLMEECAGTIKKVSMELGGNAPFIVFDDADLDAAVEGAIASKFRNSGQTCVCTNRILVHDAVYDSFSEKLVAAVKQLKVAAANDETAQQGPLINQKAVNKIKAHIDNAVDQGAKVLCGGQPHSVGNNFFEPTVLGDVTPSMDVASEETFGPLAPLFRFYSEQEAIRMANDTPFGLASYVYTQNIGRSWRVGESLEYGMVGINEGIISTEVAPFGGIKASGIGREGSSYGIEDYLEIKYLCMGIR